MPSTKPVLKSALKGQKAVSAPQKTAKKASVKAPEPTVEAEDDEVDDEDDSDEDDDEGVDEEGMERLMKALGDDGLDEFDQAQLELAMEDTDSGEEDEDEDEEGVEEELEDGGDDDEEEGGGEGEDDEDEDEDEKQDVELEDAEAVDDDAIPRQKVEIDNEVALARIRESMQLDPSIPWTETLTMSYPHTIDVDVNDDLNRELAFYKQALHGATQARALATKHSFPFTRPSDYFAEMVKSDVHMERIRQRLLDERAGIKNSEDKRKEREGKKFGKQVQIEKLKERERSKKEMEEKLKGLKRKRKDILGNAGAEEDAFDVAVEDAISDRPAKRGRTSDSGRGVRGGAKMSRQGRDSKYGFGGGGRHSKSNTRASTDDFDSGSRKGAGGRGGRGGRGAGRGGRGGGGRGRGGGRGGTQRMGKSKRMAARSK